MVNAAAVDLTEYLENRIGDSLRTVVIVKNDGYNAIHVNEDLRREYSRETYADVVDTFRLDKPFLSPGTHDRPLGERKAIVHYHEKAFVLQFPYSERESILVSLDRDTGRDLLEFIEECRKRVAARQSER